MKYLTSSLDRRLDLSNNVATSFDARRARASIVLNYLFYKTISCEYITRDQKGKKKRNEKVRSTRRDGRSSLGSKIACLLLFSRRTNVFIFFYIYILTCCARRSMSRISERGATFLFFFFTRRVNRTDVAPWQINVVDAKIRYDRDTLSR